MIYIITIVLMIALILGGVLAALAPNVTGIVDKDFIRKTDYNAKVAGLQYGDICLRAGTMAAAPYNKPLEARNMKQYDLGWVTSADDKPTAYINCSINATLSKDGQPYLSTRVTQRDVVN